FPVFELGFDAGAARPGKLEPLPDVLERHAVAFALSIAGLVRHWVAHLDLQRIPDSRSADRDATAFGQHLDAVVHRILEQRLHDQRRDARIERELVDIPFDSQALAQAELFDASVRTCDLDLLLERDAGARIVETRAKQVCEILDRLFRLLRIRARQRCDRIHAVEQEVGANARLQRAYA